MIYHITNKKEWEESQKSGEYRGDTLETEGFIHCSKIDQVLPANRLFLGKKNLVLLCIEPQEVNKEIRYENLEGGTSLFPHIYGALNCGAVKEVVLFPPKENGGFELPQITGKEQ